MQQRWKFGELRAHVERRLGQLQRGAARLPVSKAA